VRNSALILAMSVLVLVLGAGAEELLPKILGVGFPILLTTVQFEAVRRRLTVTAVLFAIAAGAMEDAISSLPVMTSASYFVLVAMLIRWSGFHRAAVLLTYPCYQLWLVLWTSGRSGEVFNRLWLSLPVGMVTALTVVYVLSWAEGKAAIDEQG